MKNTYFIIDFDSTIITDEGLDCLAEIALATYSNKKQVLDQIKTLTNQGMDGTLAFTESLEKRIALLSADKTHIEKTAKLLKKKITPSFLRNKEFFSTYRKQIYIISGGFTELVLPVAQVFGVAPDHVFANTFVYNKQGNIVGIDRKNPLSKDGGKTVVVRKLKLKGEVVIIGDGFTDLDASRHLPGGKFIAFTENVLRNTVVKDAKEIVKTFDEFLFSHRLERSQSYPKSKMKVLLLENIDEKAAASFREEGYQVSTQSKSLAKEDLIEAVKDVHILGIRSRTQIDDEVLTYAKHLLAIGAFCIGTDQIDLVACQRKGVAVFNAPYSNTRSVAELIIGEIIMLARGVIGKNQKLQQGVWEKSALGSFEIRGKTLGIIGYGHIGSQVSILAESLGMRVIFYDIAKKLPYGNATQCLSLKELLKKADVISVHVDGRKANKQLIGEKEFAAMKDGVIFLNASRGDIVVIDALKKFLMNGKILGAAIDVFPNEPRSKDEKFVSVLQNFPNVILTPHIGGSTKEAQENIATFVANKLLTFIDTGSTSLSVSLPEIELPVTTNSHRLLHIHHNVPGVLGMINSIFAEQKVNIVGQYLQTNESVGYVITDIDKRYDTTVISLLKNIPETIRLRVLY